MWRKFIEVCELNPAQMKQKKISEIYTLENN